MNQDLEAFNRSRWQGECRRMWIAAVSICSFFALMLVATVIESGDSCGWLLLGALGGMCVALGVVIRRETK